MTETRETTSKMLHKLLAVRPGDATSTVKRSFRRVAAGLHPDKPSVRVVAGLYFLERRWFLKAEGEFKKALRARPDDLVVLRNLELIRKLGVKPGKGNLWASAQDALSAIFRKKPF